MRGLLSTLKKTPEFMSLSRGLSGNISQQLVFGLSGSQRGFVAAGLFDVCAGPLLLITPGDHEAGLLAEDISALLPGVPVYQFPVWQLMPFQVLAHGKELLARRLRVMEALSRGERVVVVAPVEALMRRLSPPDIFKKSVVHLSLGQRVDFEGLLYRLVGMGYERSNMVEGPGQFSVRGGILDVYPMTSDYPVRVEFFDDEVDSIRMFNVDNQRSENKLRETSIYPASELVVDESSRRTALQALGEEYGPHLKKITRSATLEARRHLVEMVESATHQIENGVNFGGLEQYLPYFHRTPVTLFHYLSAGAVVLMEEPLRVRDVVHAVARERNATYTELLEKGKVLPLQFYGYLDWKVLFEAAARHHIIHLSFLPRQPQFLNPRNVVTFQVKAMHSFLGRIDVLADETRHWRKNGYAVVLLVNGREKAGHLRDALRDAQVDAFFIEDRGNSLEHAILPGNVVVAPGQLSSGFQLVSGRLTVLTETELYGQRKKPRRDRSRGASRLEPFTDLKTGDYVVHVNHGIGRYMGVVSLTIGDVQKDYLLIKYAGEDKLYVPTDQVGLIQKYLGAEAQAPKLSKLGGVEWSRVKGKVKEAVREMAQELLALYAARQTLKGYAFNNGTVWQDEFEDAFPYEETPDQQRAIEDVFRDMEKPRPMDRLLCGDVGYGKTEVALRAAFKAVMDGKQVAVLVPTTILAQQHFNTFRERFNGYPVSIDVLSRFRSPREQRRIIGELAAGGIDIIIGTHRLVQSDVIFKDLGLLVVDEEQRFGVAHKERLKQLKQDVDVLTLTATPIPRTLHMSLVGVRDTSVLETPPEDRFPVQTYVLEEDPVMIREAIRREMGRDGQIFIVHNRVADLDKVAGWIHDLVPEARLAIGHGQMREDELEQVMLDFMDGNYDILVCTTIIENGLDIPNVNTLIIKDANNMGLAQLYQLRGRVGRSNRLAYSYFTFKRDKVLNEAAEKRLSAIREFTEFGSGYKIAMRDLEIRGAGNLLGPEQHGHIAAVGFDLYCRLLEEAVREARGETSAQPVETSIELPVEAFVPDTYISDTNQKVELYRRMASFRSEAALADLEEELVDRYGDPPASVQTLISVSRIRILAGGLRIKSISLSSGFYRLQFAPAHGLTGEKLVSLSEEYRQRIKFTNTAEDFEIKLKAGRGVHSGGQRLLEELENLLRKLQ